MNTQQKLQDYKTDNKLTQYVLDYSLDASEDYENGFEGFATELMNHGCQSGMIGSLIYYYDTTEFYDKYKEEVNELLAYAIEMTGYSVTELFREWDNSDPLALQNMNQNLLAWFAFEETVRTIALDLGIDI